MMTFFYQKELNCLWLFSSQAAAGFQCESTSTSTTTSNFPSAMAPKTMKAKAAMKAMKTAKVMSKGGLATELADGSGLKKGEITKVLDSLAEIGTREVKKAGKFTLPGLCMIKTRKKKATLRLLFFCFWRCKLWKKEGVRVGLVNLYTW